MNMNDARRGRGQKPDITLAHGVLIMDPEEEDGPYPKLHVVVCDADTGIILSAAKVTFLGVIAGKRGKKDASSGSELDIGTRRVLTSEEMRRVPNAAAQAELAGYMPLQDAKQAGNMLTHDVLQSGRVEIKLTMNTAVKLRIVDADTRDDVMDGFRIPTKLNLRPPLSTYASASYNATKREGAPRVPVCGLGCRDDIMEGDGVYNLTCGHTFHAVCLKRILSMTRLCMSTETEKPPEGCPLCQVPFVSKDMVLECKPKQLLKIPAMTDGQRAIGFNQPSTRMDGSEWELLSVLVKRFVWNPSSGVWDLINTKKIFKEELSKGNIELEAADWPFPSGPLELQINVKRLPDEEEDE